MASPAAVIAVMVEANTTKAVAAIRKFDSSVGRSGTTARKATAHTSRLDTASGKLGTTLGRAARYAAGAAAAYVSIAEAKKAVETTQDLAKTTAGLNRNLGLSVKTASQWGAVAKSRDIDSRSLTMSFTTLSRRLVDTTTALEKGGSAADTAFAPFKRLGLSQQDVSKGSQDLAAFLPKLADAFGDAAGGADRQASAQQLLGRGYATVLPLFAQGAKGLKEQQEWADKYGATLTGKTLKAQMDLVQSQRESKVAWLGLQVTFTKFVTPALEVVDKKFQHIAAIMADPKLTNAEKFKQVGQMIGKWANKAFDAFVGILPKIVAAAGERAPKIAEAFVKGFLNAPILGQLALGGWLLAKFGGASAFTALGSKAGGWFAVAFIGAMEAKKIGDILSGELLDATTREMKATELQKVGYTAIQFVGKGMIKALGPDGNLNIFRQKNGEWIQKTVQDFHDWDQIPKIALNDSKGAFQNWADMFPKLTKRAQDAGKDFHQTLADAFGAVPKDANASGQDAFTYWDKWLGKTEGRTGDFKGAVVTTVNSMAGAVIKGLGNLIGATNSALKAFDIDPVAWAISGGIKGGAGFQSNQTGGVIVPGSGTGDKVPAMLEPGEVVLNRKAVAAMGGANKANAINQKIPRFATGGVIEQALGPYTIPPIMYDPNHAGGNSHVHADFFTVAQALSYGKKMQEMGWGIGEYTPSPGNPYNFGPITTQHQSPGHYDGTAFDANTAANETRAQVAAVARLFNGGVLGGVAGAVAQEVAAAVLKGPDGPLKSLGQAALDKVRSAANNYLSKQAPRINTTGADLPGGSVATGSIQKMAQQMVNSIWAPSQWSAFNSLEMSEAGWNPQAVNPSSGAAGLAQALPPSKYPPGAWPYEGLSSAKLQLQWMMGYIRDRYGDPASAWAFHQSHNWYKEGGIVPKLAKGGVIMAGDSLGVGMDTYAGFPSGWDVHAKSGANSAWGLQQLAAIQDQAAVMFEMGTNDADVGAFQRNLQLAKNKAKSVGAGIAAMTVAGVPYASKINNVIRGSGVDAVADWAGIAGSYLNGDPHPAADGYRAMRDLVKAAANKAKGNGGPNKPPGVHTGPDDVNPLWWQTLHPTGYVTTSPAQPWWNIVAGPGPQRGTNSMIAHMALPTNLARQIFTIGTMAADLEDQVATFTKLSSFASSPSGSDLSDGERSQLLALNTSLLDLYTHEAPLLQEGLDWLLPWAPQYSDIQEGLTGATGLLGPNGKILNVQQTIDTLKNTASPVTTPDNSEQIALLKQLLSEANLRTAVSQLQYSVLAKTPFAGAFATGGYIKPGHWGIAGEAGPEVVHGPARVYSNSESQGMMGAHVTINGDIINTPPGMAPVEIDGARAIVTKGSRGLGNRVLPGARGL